MKAIDFLKDLDDKLTKGFAKAAAEYFLEPNEYNRGWKDAFELVATVVKSNLEDIEDE